MSAAPAKRSERFSDGDRQLIVDGLPDHCDAMDGLEDGMIFNTQGCDFKPAQLACDGGKTDACLAANQVSASRIDGNPDFTEHDVLTGSQIDGTAFPSGEDRTCNNWTSNDEGSAWVGHADRYSFSTPGSPWNSSHGTAAYTQEDLVSVGGAGLLYCFAVD